MARSTAREAAMQLVYAKLLGGDGAASTLPELIDWQPSADDTAYLQDITEGIYSQESELDARIDAFSRDWPVARIARVDLAILRVAAYEITRRDDVPTAVAINEAVEMSRKYSTDTAGAFINGILGNLARSMEREA